MAQHALKRREVEVEALQSQLDQLVALCNPQSKRSTDRDKTMAANQGAFALAKERPLLLDLHFKISSSGRFKADATAQDGVDTAEDAAAFAKRGSNKCLQLQQLLGWRRHRLMRARGHGGVLGVALAKLVVVADAVARQRPHRGRGHTSRGRGRVAPTCLKRSSSAKPGATKVAFGSAIRRAARHCLAVAAAAVGATCARALAAQHRSRAMRP